MSAPTSFVVGDLGHGYYLQAIADKQAGRKWYVSPHVTDSELVQTALMAALAHAEHEVRENFWYAPRQDREPRAIFGPHLDADALWTICGEASNYDFRQAPQPKSPVKGLGLWPAWSWKWGKWTFGVWVDPDNHTRFGIDLGPLEAVWHSLGYRP